MNLKVSKIHLLGLMIILYPVFNLFANIPLSSNYDEIIGLFGAVYVLTLFIKKGMETNDRIICVLLTLISLIGLISNAVFALHKSNFAVAVDIILLWKTFSTYMFFKYICIRNNKARYVMRTLSSISKLTIIMLVVLALVGQFVDIGVTGKTYYGISSFRFFWDNAIQTGWLGFCCMLILAGADQSRKTFWLYLFLTFIPLILTFSSLITCWIFATVMLWIILGENRTFKIRYVIILAIGVALLNAADISTYFTGDHVRGTLILNGINLANTYFPFGSGFATYGSEMAVRYYSKVYEQLNWTNTWAYGKNSTLLNDAFFASIIGQFGWIGFALYLLCLLLLIKNLNSKFLKPSERIIAISTILTICAVMVGSGSAKSMMGVCTFAVLGVMDAKRVTTERLME